MRAYIIILLLILAATGAIAAALSGTNVAAPVVPFTDADTYPTHYAQYGAGGFMQVQYTSARNTIPAARRVDGLMVYTSDTQKIYRLLGGIANSNWQPFSLPSAQINSDWNASSGLAQILNKPTLFSGVYSALTGIPSTFTPSAHNQAASTITGLATVATSGSYLDLSNQPDTLRGYDGREIELQISGGYIQWRYVGSTSWINLIAISAITGPTGPTGDNYVCTITGGIRSFLYDKDSHNPTPSMVAFGVEMRKNGSVITPDSYTWSVPASGSLLSGSSSTSAFTPTVNANFSPASADNRVDVAVTSGSVTCKATAPVPATRIGDTGAAGSPDTKQQIYTKIGVATTGDVLNISSGSGDASGFAYITSRVNGNIHSADLVPGKTVIYTQSADVATTSKFEINKLTSGTAFSVTAGGTATISGKVVIK